MVAHRRPGIPSLSGYHILASQPTVSRFENSVTLEDWRDAVSSGKYAGVNSGQFEGMRIARDGPGSAPPPKAAPPMGGAKVSRIGDGGYGFL